MTKEAVYSTKKHNSRCLFYRNNCWTDFCFVSYSISVVIYLAFCGTKANMNLEMALNAKAELELLPVTHNPNGLRLPPPSTSTLCIRSSVASPSSLPAETMRRTSAMKTLPSGLLLFCAQEWGTCRRAVHKFQSWLSKCLTIYHHLHKTSKKGL